MFSRCFPRLSLDLVIGTVDYFCRRRKVIEIESHLVEHFPLQTMKASKALLEVIAYFCKCQCVYENESGHGGPFDFNFNLIRRRLIEKADLERQADNEVIL